MMNIRFLVWGTLVIPVIAGCRDRATQTPPPAEHTEHAGESAESSNRVDVPESVRRNLGINFARVEPRAVARTLRLPGRFELASNGRREYRTMLGGRIELRVAQYQRVAPGDLLYVLDSPAWRELQEKLNETDAAIQQAAARVETTGPLMAAHKNHEENLRAAVELWTERVKQLEESAAGVITAEDLAQARSVLVANRGELSEVMEKEAELNARKVEVQSELAAAHERMDLLLMTASSLLGIDKSKLAGPSPPELERHEHATGEAPHRHPLWRELQVVEVRATTAGIVESVQLTNGAWAGETSLVLTTAQPELIRFRARGLQSDLGLLADGLPGRIVPPKGGTIELQDTMEGSIQLGLGSDAEERTVEVLMTPTKLTSWARPGVSAHLEVIAAGGETELAIPLSSVIQDGLSKVIFRRDPKDPDKVIRMEADLGVDDGRWVAVKSGIREGDEVVLDGVYQLMIATSGTVQKGGHFHSDGTFHAGEDK